MLAAGTAVMVVISGVAVIAVVAMISGVAVTARTVLDRLEVDSFSML